MSLSAIGKSAPCAASGDQSEAGNRRLWRLMTRKRRLISIASLYEVVIAGVQLSKAAGRVTLDNSQLPDAERRRLPEADRANMEAFLANLKVILPVVGLDLLKPRAQGVPRPVVAPSSVSAPVAEHVRFELRHRSGVKALAVEEDGEFVVLEGSEALRDAGNQGSKNYGELKQELLSHGVLAPSPAAGNYRFARSYAFKSPSAAAAVILDRNANGRKEWKVVGDNLNYHEWQEARSAQPVNGTDNVQD